jgi:hypothetical protein
MTLLIEKPYVKAFNRTYSALAERHPEYDLSDPDMMSHYEKQLVATYAVEHTPQSRANELRLVVPGTQTRASKIPLDAHLHTWGGAIPYLANDIYPEDDGAPPPPPSQHRRPRTGIHGDVNATAEDESSIIRPIKFRSLDEAEAGDRSLSRDSAALPLIFAPCGRRFEATVTSLPGGTSDPTVQNCIKTFFDPSVGIPFVPADVGKYFPVTLLQPDSPASPSPEDDELGFDQPLPEDGETKTSLLETLDEDVLFTKNKAPFTRGDISTLRAFRRHWDSLKMQKRDEAQQALINRQKAVKEAFHSKNVFETALKLMDEDCARIRSGIIGKSKFKKRSLWETALKRAPPDKSGLTDRRELWWRFCAFVRFVGGLSEEFEKNVMRTLRVKLMLRHQVDQSLFWDTVRDIPPISLESVSVLKLAEFLRVALAVGQQEFVLFLDDMKVAQMIYTQTIVNNMSKEYIEKQQHFAKGPIDVPDWD